MTRRPIARIFAPAPLAPEFPNGFSARWCSFVHALQADFDVELVAVRGIWHDPGTEPAAYRGPLQGLRAFTVLDARLPASTVGSRGVTTLRRLVDEPARAPRIDGIAAALTPAPDFAVFFLHQLAPLAFELPASVPCTFVLEEVVVRTQSADVVPPARWNLPLRAWRAFSAALLLREYRRLVQRCSQRGALVVISDDERRDFERWTQHRVAVIPNGVDTDRHRPGAAPPRPEFDVLVVGDLGRPRNYAPLARLIDQARRQPSTARLRWLLVGHRPHATIGRLAGATVTVAADVPDVRPYYERARVVAVPSWAAAGSKSTILKGWAMQRPVVTTPSGSRGLPARPGENLIVADDDAFLASVARLIDDPVAASRLAAAGRATAVAECSLPQRAEEFRQLCAAVVKPSRAG